MATTNRDGTPRVKPKKDSTLTMRLTRETRQALEDKARADGRSVSEVAERWLDEAQRGYASYSARLGGANISEAIEAMLTFAEAVRQEIGDPRTFLPARDALMTGWRYLIDRSLPFTPDTAEGRQLHLTKLDLVAACQRALQELSDLVRSGTARDGLLSPVPRDFNATFRWHATNANVAGAAPDIALPEMLLEFMERPSILPVRDIQEAIAAKVADHDEAKPIFDPLSVLFAKFELQWDAYMSLRHQAIAKGRALAESVAGVEPIR
jgi:hypothetical protein